MSEFVQLRIPGQPPTDSGSKTPDATPAPDTLQLRVVGMTCAGCAASVQRAIEMVPGVTSAGVSLATGIALVEGTGLTPAPVIKAVESRGFTAQPITSDVDIRSQIEEQQESSERLWRRRALIGLGLWIPMEITHWTGMLLHWHPHTMDWIMGMAALCVVIIAGSGFFRSAVVAARRGTTNMDTLISMGSLTAFLFSAYALIFRTGQPTYFSEAAGLLGIVSLGHWMEARTGARTGSAVRELLSMQPDMAELVESTGATRSIRSRDVAKGQTLQIRPGARVPVDGRIVRGISDFDESIITGESLPVTRGTGQQVPAGALNTTGHVLIEATESGRNTTVSRIAELVQKAQSSRAPIQRLADQVSAIFVPSAIAVAILSLCGWILAGQTSKGIASAVTVLIISCPCALGIATPMAILVGTGAASRRGILIRSAEALEHIGRSQCVIFDKTGTLTSGQPKVTQVRPEAHSNERDVLACAAALESFSEHPIAKAIVRAAQQRHIVIPEATNFQAMTGLGVQGMIGDKPVRVERDPNATARVLQNGQLLGRIVVEDTLRHDAAETVRWLQQNHIRVMLLSGDRTIVVHEMGRQLGIPSDCVIAEASPESKARHVHEAGLGAVMVGDGLNDAAALAQSGVGIAMASGTNIAIESAAVVIPGDRVSAVAELFELSRLTLKTIRQNLFFAFAYNVIAIPLAALGLLGSAGPLIAAAAMGLSDLTVTGNALRLHHRLRRQPAKR